MQSTPVALLGQLELSNGWVNRRTLVKLVKCVQQQGSIGDDLRSQLKSRLQSDASVLSTLSVLHTLAFNSNVQVRNELASHKWFKRIDKLVRSPPNAKVASAATQLVVDWSMVFGGEELGSVSKRLLQSVRKGAALESTTLSDSAQLFQENQQLQMPPLGCTHLGEDFGGSWLTGSASARSLHPRGAAADGQGSAPLGVACNPLAVGPSARPPAMAPGNMNQMLKALDADVQRMAAANAAARAAAGRLTDEQKARMVAGDAQLHPLSRVLREGYTAACACSVWRRRVQTMVSTVSDADMQRLLLGVDLVNEALVQWQLFASHQLFTSYLGLRGERPGGAATSSAPPGASAAAAAAAAAVPSAPPAAAHPAGTASGTAAGSNGAAGCDGRPREALPEWDPFGLAASQPSSQPNSQPTHPSSSRSMAQSAGTVVNPFLQDPFGLFTPSDNPFAPSASSAEPTPVGSTSGRLATGSSPPYAPSPSPPNPFTSAPPPSAPAMAPSRPSNHWASADSASMATSSLPAGWPSSSPDPSALSPSYPPHTPVAPGAHRRSLDGIMPEPSRPAPPPTTGYPPTYNPPAPNPSTLSYRTFVDLPSTSEDPWSLQFPATASSRPLASATAAGAAPAVTTTTTTATAATTTTTTAAATTAAAPPTIGSAASATAAASAHSSSIGPGRPPATSLHQPGAAAGLPAANSKQQDGLPSSTTPMATPPFMCPLPSAGATPTNPTPNMGTATPQDSATGTSHLTNPINHTPTHTHAHAHTTAHTHTHVHTTAHTTAHTQNHSAANRATNHAAASSGMHGGMDPSGSGAAWAERWEAVAAKGRAGVEACGSMRCAATMDALLAATRQLLSDMERQHAAQLAQLQAEHREEMAELKTRAVVKVKELMQKLNAQQQ